MFGNSIHRSLRRENRSLGRRAAAARDGGRAYHRLRLAGLSHRAEQHPSSTTSLEVLVFPNTATTLATPKTLDPLPVTSVPSTGKLTFTLDLVDDLDKGRGGGQRGGSRLIQLHRGGR